jgi:transposase-like protein
MHSGNGHRRRRWNSRAGTITLDVPKLRRGSSFRRHRAAARDSSAGQGTSQAKRSATKWRPLYLVALECHEEDFEHLVCYPRVPKQPWKRICHFHFIDRAAGVTRRRVRVIDPLSDERTACP